MSARSLHGGQTSAALYHRVSTVDQNPHAAWNELRAAARRFGVRIALDVETGSGANTTGRGLVRVLQAAQRGFHSIDRGCALMPQSLEFTLEDVGDPLLFGVEVIRRQLQVVQGELDFLEALLAFVEGEPLKKRGSGRRIARAKIAVKELLPQLILAEEQVDKALIRKRNESWISDGRFRHSGELALEERGDQVRCVLDAVRERATSVRSELNLVLVLLVVLGRTCRMARPRALARAKRAMREARVRFNEVEEEVSRVYSAECGASSRSSPASATPTQQPRRAARRGRRARGGTRRDVRATRLV